MRPELRERLQSSLGSDYRLERELGGGSHACVYVAHDATLNRRVVVKVLDPDLAGTVDVDRFRREIRIAGALSHPNIVPVLTSGSRNGVIYFAMPYVDGDPLDTVLGARGQLPVEEAVEISADVAAALAAAHRENIIHRDIKPGNILLAAAEPPARRRAMVTDFGIARAVIRAAVPGDWVTTTGLTLGTPLYMSPEQAAGERELDERSDIYSLGCVMYEMLAGEPPFPGPTALAIIARHVNEAPRSLRVVRPEIPAALERIVITALAKAPADRFQDAESLLRALRDPSVMVRPARDDVPRTRSGARSRARIIAALGAAGVLAGVGYAASRVREPPAAAPAERPDPSRVAVLYLEAPPGDSQLVAIGRGLTRDLIDALGGVRSLAVTSDLGIRQFAGHDARPDSVSAKLGVGTIVHGSIEPVGDSLVVDVRMTDGGGTQRGHTRVAVRRAELTVLRADVVGRVVDELRRAIGLQAHLRDWRAGTRSDSAWALRQRALELQRSGREMLSRGSTAAATSLLASADALLATAAALDTAWPEPVVARGWLASARALRSDSAGRVRWLAAARAFADSALTRVPDDPAALELRGVLRFQQWRFVGHGRDAALADSALRDLASATARDPRRARAWNYLGLLLASRGDAAGARAAARSAIEADAYLDEVAPSIQLLVMAHLNAARYDSARTLCADGRRRLPAAPELAVCELTVLGWSGRGAEDLARLRTLVAQQEAAGVVQLVDGVWPPGRAFVAAVLARSGARAGARAMLDSTRAHLGRDGLTTDWLEQEAMVRLLLGERDAVLALLGDVVRRNPARRAWLAQVPWFATLHDDPAFRRLMGDAAR